MHACNVGAGPKDKGLTLTLYCSWKDKALFISSLVRGLGEFARAGYFWKDHFLHPFILQVADLSGQLGIAAALPARAF